MKKIVLCFFVFLSLALSSVAQYDYFLMAMQWPAAYCRQNNNKCTKKPNRFTIHGMWPQKNVGSSPRQCITGRNQGANLDKPMLSTTASAELPTSWPNLAGYDFNFWERQWINHGTCSYSTFNQTQYFDAANDIWKKLNLFDILKAQGISPSTSSKPHLRADFENAISKHLGFTLKVQFHCPSNELLEIRLCRNRAGNQYVNCTRTGNCGTSFNWIP